MKKVLIITQHNQHQTVSKKILECYRIAQRLMINLTILHYDKQLPFFDDIFYVDVDAVLVLDDCAPHQLLSYCLDLNIPIVAIGHDYFPLKVDSVSPSFSNAMERIKNHLLDHQVNCVAFAGNLASTHSRHLYQSFNISFAEHNTGLFDCRDNGVLAGLHIYAQYAKSEIKPDAMVFTCDAIAIGFVQAHQQSIHHDSLPLIIGYGNSIVGAHQPYNLSSIDDNCHGCIEVAFDHLQSRVNGTKLNTHSRYIDAEFITRTSTDAAIPATTNSINFALDGVLKNKPCVFQDLGGESPMSYAEQGLGTINEFSTLFGPFFDWACVVDWQKHDGQRHVYIQECFDTSGRRDDLYGQQVTPSSEGVLAPLVSKLADSDLTVTTIIPIVKRRRLSAMLIVRNNRPYQIGHAQQSLFDSYLVSVAHSMQQTEFKTTSQNIPLPAPHSQSKLKQFDWRWNLTTNEMWWSEKALRLMSIDSHLTATYPKFFEYIHPEDESVVREHLNHHLEFKSPFAPQFRYLTADNRTLWVKASGSSVFDTTSGHTVFSGTLSTANWYQDGENSMYQIQANDKRTGIVSRMTFLDLLVKTTPQTAKCNTAIFRIALASYTQILSNIGFHQAAEYRSKAIRTLIQTTKGKGAIAAIGDAELALYFEYDRADEFELFIEDIRALNQRIVNVSGLEISLANSVGCAVYPVDSNNLEETFRLSGQALQTAEENQRLEFIRYSQSLSFNAEKSYYSIESKLRRAILENQLTLYYQPQFDLKSGALIGAEALLRWESPELGMMSPATFIPIAEQSGLIHKLGFWAMERAMKNKARWNFLYGNQFKVSINVAPSQLSDELLADKLFALANNYELSPEEINLEITESATIVDLGKTLSLLERLRKGGFYLSLDDFGTGYSSLSKLKHLPLDWVKIDRMFVKDLEQNKSDIDIVKAICDMCRTLGFKTVCEGIETQYQLALVESTGVDVAQGFFFDKPLSADDFEEKYLTTPYIDEEFKTKH